MTDRLVGQSITAEPDMVAENFIGRFGHTFLMQESPLKGENFDRSTV